MHDKELLKLGASKSYWGSQNYSLQVPQKDGDREVVSVAAHDYDAPEFGQPVYLLLLLTI